MRLEASIAYNRLNSFLPPKRRKASDDQEADALAESSASKNFYQDDPGTNFTDSDDHMEQDNADNGNDSLSNCDNCNNHN